MFLASGKKHEHVMESHIKQAEYKKLYAHRDLVSTEHTAETIIMQLRSLLIGLHHNPNKLAVSHSGNTQ